MLDSRNVNRKLLLDAVKSFEEDIDNLDESIYEACQALAQQFALIGIQLLRVNQSDIVFKCSRKDNTSPYRASLIELDPGDSEDAYQNVVIRRLIERYLRIESSVLDEIASLRRKQDEHRKSLLELTVFTPIRQHERSDKCIIYIPTPGVGRYRKIVHNMYLDCIDKDVITDVERTGKPGFLLRQQFKRDGWRHTADVFYVENLSKIVRASEVLQYASSSLQESYDARKPRVAEQREKVRLLMKMDTSKTERLEEEVNVEQRWRELMLDYLVVPIYDMH